MPGKSSNNAVKAGGSSNERGSRGSSYSTGNEKRKSTSGESSIPPKRQKILTLSPTISPKQSITGARESGTGTEGSGTSGESISESEEEESLSDVSRDSAKDSGKSKNKSERHARRQSSTSSASSLQEASSSNLSSDSQASWLPTGFEKALRSNFPGSPLNKLLKPSNTSGKQVWHISAPASLSISSISAVALNRLKAGDVLISYDSVDYQLTADKRPVASLMLPQAGGASYKDETIELEFSCSLKRIAQLSNPQNLSESIAAPLRKTKEVPRQRPGLRPQFWPPGFGQDLVGRQPLPADFAHNVTSTTRTTSGQTSKVKQKSSQLAITANTVQRPEKKFAATDSTLASSTGSESSSTTGSILTASEDIEL